MYKNLTKGEEMRNKKIYKVLVDIGMYEYYSYSLSVGQSVATKYGVVKLKKVLIKPTTARTGSAIIEWYDENGEYMDSDICTLAKLKGGARKGAGRKPRTYPSATLSAKLPKALVERFREVAREQKRTQVELLSEILEKGLF